MSMKNILATGALTIGLLGGGTVIANAITTTTTSAATTASSSAANTHSAAASNGSQADNHPIGDHGANPNDKTITGTDADKATAAVVSANPGFTVNLVQQDPNGSYDVHGTLNGQGVMFNVTTDFKISTDNNLGRVDGPHGSDAASSASSSSAASSSAAN